MEGLDDIYIYMYNHMFIKKKRRRDSLNSKIRKKKIDRIEH